MAQADSNHTTKLSSSIRDPLTKSTHESITGDRGGMSSVTRRTIMNSLVALPITGAMQVASSSIASALPNAVDSDNDPMPALIGRHKAAHAEFIEAMDHLGDLEETIPDELKKGETFCFEVTIVETDDPRWTAANLRYNDTIIKANSIAVEMLSVMPTSLAGLQAIMGYAVQHVRDGHMWPDGAQINDEDEEPKSDFIRDWNFYLLRNLGEALQTIAV
jgi:hypothetical protein